MLRRQTLIMLSTDWGMFPIGIGPRCFTGAFYFNQGSILKPHPLIWPSADLRNFVRMTSKARFCCVGLNICRPIGVLTIPFKRMRAVPSKDSYGELVIL
jgi:hypothetical protein